MRIGTLKPRRGSRQKRKRRGIGIGSGLGKTSGKGHKGQNARSGGGTRPGFEGGQMPLQRRLPKGGFTNIFKRCYAVVNLRDLQRFSVGTLVTPQLLKETGILKKLGDGVKVLGNGDLPVSLTVQASAFSKTALDKIAAAGGKAEVIGLGR